MCEEGEVAERRIDTTGRKLFYLSRGLFMAAHASKADRVIRDVDGGGVSVLDFALAVCC